MNKPITVCPIEVPAELRSVFKAVTLSSNGSVDLYFQSPHVIQNIELDGDGAFFRDTSILARERLTLITRPALSVSIAPPATGPEDVTRDGSPKAKRTRRGRK